MSRQQRGGGNGEVARGAGYAAFLGALLIGVAVIIGIVLLQIGDRNDNGPASATKPKSTTTTTTPKTHTSTPKGGTTAPKTPLLPPNQVNLIVLNGGAPSGKAGAMSTALARKGYTHHGTPTDWTGHSQIGDSVYCRAGLQRDGARLATLVGAKAVLHVPYPATGGPPSSASYDCIVVVGAPKT